MLSDDYVVFLGVLPMTDFNDVANMLFAAVFALPVYRTQGDGWPLALVHN